MTEIAPPNQKVEPVMSLAVNYQPVEPIMIPRSVDERIRAFLRNETDGGDVLHEIYDHVLDEPIPDRLRALLRR